jgi:DNA repair protein RadC
MARNKRVQPGLNEAPDLLVLIERARVSAVSAGAAPLGEARSGLSRSGTARFDLATPDFVPLGPIQSDFEPPGPDQSGRAPSGPAPSGPALADRIVSGTDGHRSRMRARLLAAGPQALADHEMLEMVLFLALPRRDTKPLARVLLARFGSFAGAIAAPAVELCTVDGLGEAGVAALKLVQGAALRLALAEVINRPVVGNWDRLMAYLTATLAREPVEQFRVLFLDTRNRLLADEAMGRGTVNHTPVYPREVVKRALELHSTALILVHNHPSGDPTPSAADIDMTREIRGAAAALSIALHDHVIIGNDRWLSFRREGLL